jgi:alkylation response protein AidB-like acyl-CoA dehydrogenase
MNQTPMGKVISLLNNALDSQFAEKIGLRKKLNNAVYSLSYRGVKLATHPPRIFKKLKSQEKPERLESRKPSDLFDLSLTEEQEMVKETIAQFAISEIRPKAEKMSESENIPDELYAKFDELGLVFYSIPEALGGVLKEKSTMTQSIIAQELAYGDLGVALALLSPIGVLNALVSFGTTAQQEKYIPAFTEEGKKLHATIAVNEHTPLFNPFELSTKAVKKGEKYVLNGIKTMVPIAAKSELFLIAADTDNGPQLFIVESNTTGISVEKDSSMGLRPAELGRITLANVEVSEENLLGGGIDYVQFINHIRLAWCSLATGTSKGVLDYVIEYCNNRVAFGEPITNRQSVAFMIANIKIENDGMKILTDRAAGRAEQGLDFTQQVYLASVYCADKAMEIGTNGVQLLGGHGFIRDYPVERWYRDLRAMAISYNGVHI